MSRVKTEESNLWIKCIGFCWFCMLKFQTWWKFTKNE